jgi:hypothetical protein
MVPASRQRHPGWTHLIARIAASRRSTRPAPKLPSVAAARHMPGRRLVSRIALCASARGGLSGSTPPAVRARIGATAKRGIGEEEMERVAECHCGQLRAITSGEPDSVYVCHCQACQRRTGAVIHNGSRWLKSQVRIEGEHKVYSRLADSGFEIRFHFCPNCGSSVFWEGDRSPTTCGIAVGCFADPDFPAPTSSGWEESMHRWLGLPPDTAHFRQSRS